MKKILPLFLIAATVTAHAQTRLFSQAIITTKTTIVSPEGDDNNVPPPPGNDGEQRVTFRFGGDGETKTVTTLKGDMIKTFSESEMGRTTVLRDNANKKTTTLLEMMGNKTGFYATDEEQEQMRKRMDSMMQSRRQGTDNIGTSSAPPTSTITYIDETKKIAGQQCKKALIITTSQNGNKDTGTVWYCPDFKLQGLVSTGGISGFGAFARTSTLSGLNDLAGFPMQYEMKMNHGRKMTVEVSKIVIDKEIADKEFEIPKDFVVKPMKDMQNGGSGFQTRLDVHTN